MTSPATSRADHDVVDLLDDIFGREKHAELDPLWTTLKEAGLVRLTGSEETGSGASWIEASALLRAAARHGVQVPLVENDLLAGWLAEKAGLRDADRRRTACVLNDSGVATGVPWAVWAESIVTLTPWDGGWLVADLEADRFQIDSGTNLAGEPRDRVELTSRISCGMKVDAALVDEFRLRGALARSLQIGGALQRALDLAVVYSTQRMQFGRPIAAFQEVQHLATDVATETALAVAATDNAAVTAAATDDWTSVQLRFEIAVAKSCASRAASVATRAAHQIFGAIGTTAEHDLHRYTLPALAWSSEFGSAIEWNRRLAEGLASSSSPDSLWELITGTAGPSVRA